MNTQQDMTDDKIDYYLRKKFNFIILEHYNQFKDRITDEQFAYCVRERPGFALAYYDKFSDRITDEQFDYCVREVPWGVIEHYKWFSDRVTDEQFAYCVHEVSWYSLEFYANWHPCRINRYYK